MRKHAHLALLAVLCLLGTRHSEAAPATGLIIVDDRTEGTSRRVLMQTALPRPENETIYNGVSFSDQFMTMRLMDHYQLRSGTVLEVEDRETGYTTSCRHNEDGSFSCRTWVTDPGTPSSDGSDRP